MKNKLSIAVAVALLATSASAMQFQTLGYKSVAMGGAAVASSSGSMATYNNPALLAKTPYDVEVSLGGGLSYYDHGVAASVKALDDSGFMDTLEKADNDISSLSAQDTQSLISGKNVVLNMDGNAIQLAPQVYLSAQAGSFGLGVFASSDIVCIANINQTYDKLIFENGGTYVELQDNGNVVASSAGAYNSTSMKFAIDSGLSYMNAVGIVVTEVPLAYGHTFELSGGNLMVGGAIKYMKGYSYTEKVSLDDVDNNTGAKTDLTSNNVGIDLGLAYEPSFVKDLTLALVAKNLNSPDFDVIGGSKIEVDAMVRAGLAYDIFDSLEIAADIDLTKNKTLLASVDSQMVGGGLNFHPVSWFAVRAGIMKNMADNDKAGMIYTAGLGFGLKWLQVDLSGQMSANTTTVDGTEVPQYAKVSLALISRW